MLTLSNLTYRIGGRLILENASTVIRQGWKVGIVGANGAGKSTLFKLIAGDLQADGGEIAKPERLTLGMVRQDLPDDDTALLDVVLAADTERTALLTAVETETDPDKLGDIYDRLLAKDAYAAPAKASIILAGLGFKEEQLNQPITALSGGWRMRVALAGALFAQPDILLLDEPTNHLDLEAVMWLEGYMASYPGTLLVISHDRDVLDKCVDHIVHVENKTLTAYTGTYSQFERERAEKRLGQQKLFEKQQAQRAHLQAFVDRFRAKASKATQAQSRLKALEKMDVVDAVMAERSIKFGFPSPEELPPPLMTIRGVNLGYGGHAVLKNLNERLDMDDRIALLGANGNGKSTLIKLLAGKLAPLAGQLEASSKLRIGYFAQHQTDELDVDESPLAAMARVMGGAKEADVRAKLGRFGFGKELADNRIGALSGGEKARLLFAMMSHHAPHILLLDEPTNHLDMDAREALVQALNTYDGAVVIVSHDPSLLERVADRLWLVEGGTVRDFDGDLAAYRQHILATKRAEKKSDKAAAADAKQARKDKQNRHPELFKAVQEAEKKLASATKEHAKLAAKLAEPDAYDQPDFTTLQHAHAHAGKELVAAEEALLTAMTAFEDAA